MGQEDLRGKFSFTGEWGGLDEEYFWSFEFDPFVILNIERRFIGINMAGVYVKCYIKKNDAAAITTAKNKVCIGCLHEYCYLMGRRLLREIFSGGGIRKFFA